MIFFEFFFVFFTVVQHVEFLVPQHPSPVLHITPQLFILQHAKSDKPSQQKMDGLVSLDGVGHVKYPHSAQEVSVVLAQHCILCDPV